MARALFIVFEGIDGSGTTTQCRLLHRHLLDLGHDAVLTREPGGTQIGERIRDLVLDPAAADMEDMTELMLYVAARSQHARQVIGPALENNKPVICDRYADSSVAYQGYGRGLDPQMVDGLNKLGIGSCCADVTFFLDLPLDVAAGRRRGRAELEDRLESAGDQLQERVRRGYRRIFESRAESAVWLDVTGTADEVAETVREELAGRWPAFPFKGP